MKIVVKHEDGSETDITLGVQSMYDLLHGSMDWGSGFISLEEAIPIAEMVKACGFQRWEEAEKYVTWQRVEAKRVREYKKRMAKKESE